MDIHIIIFSSPNLSLDVYPVSSHAKGHVYHITCLEREVKNLCIDSCVGHVIDIYTCWSKG